MADGVWVVARRDPKRAGLLARELGISPISGQLLLNRGIRTRAEARRFLSPRLDTLLDPYDLPDMAKAVARLTQAVNAQEPILLFGDSDVDGLTASVVLYETLRSRGAKVRAWQSNRIADGYGLPQSALQRLRESSVRLLILVDCGTNQPEAVRTLAAQGIDTILVDHHVPLEGWARPHALINPHCEGPPGFRGLSSAALAFKMAQAFLGDGDERLARALDLAALGTLADCSPLMGDNRVIVREGLERIVRSPRWGLRQLCEATGTSEPNPEHILRRLIPRLNASGRLGDASAIWHLLLSEEEGHGKEWLSSTEQAHTATKALHRTIMAQAQEQVNRLHFRDAYVVIVSHPGWHQGLMGPLASQLAERYGRPTIAIAEQGSRGTGSGRSIPLFDLLGALKACQDLLVSFGGHAQACGLAIRKDQLERFRALINRHAERTLGREGLVKTSPVDVELPLDAVDSQWVGETESFAPFGRGNPRPSILIRGLALEVVSPRTAMLSNGRKRCLARGTFRTLAPGRYDVVATPRMVEGDVVLTVSGVKASAELSEPVRISDTRRIPAGA